MNIIPRRGEYHDPTPAGRTAILPYGRKEIEMKVRDLMSTNITCVKEDASVSQIASHMKRDDVGCLPVCDDAGHLKGIITDRDLVLRALTEKQPGETTSGDIMTTSPVTVSPDMNIHDAALLFSAHQIRRLPVIEASRIVGMLSLGDVAAKPVCIDEAGDALSAISVTGAAPAES